MTAAVAAWWAARRNGADKTLATWAALPLALSPSAAYLVTETGGVAIALAACAALLALAAPDDGRASWLSEATVAAALAAGPFGVVSAAALGARRMVSGARRRRAIAGALFVAGVGRALSTGASWHDLGALPWLGGAAARLVIASTGLDLHARLALDPRHYPEALAPLGGLALAAALFLGVRLRRSQPDSARCLLVFAAMALSTALVAAPTATGGVVYLAAAALPLLLVEVLRRRRPTIRVVGAGAFAVAIVLMLPGRARALASDEAAVEDGALGAPADGTLDIRLASRLGGDRGLQVLSNCVARERNLRCLRERGLRRLEANDLSAAVEDLDAATATASGDPDSQALLVALARAQLATHAEDRARQSLLRSFLFGDTADARFLYATLLERDPSSQRWAAQQYPMVVKQDPKHWRALDRMGQLAGAAHDPSAARAYFIQAVAVAPGEVQLHKHLAGACAALGAIEEARHHLDVAAGLAPSDPEVASMRASLHH